jgi:replicative DNA helicase
MVKIDGVKVVLIDYLQLMSVKGNSYNRTLELGAISRALKTTAMENKIVIMAAAQLSRGVEQREDKRPMLSDLRDSGALEQDADNVMFVYRDEYYRNDTKTKGKVDIIVAKQRNGAIGTRTLLYDKERQLIQRMNY